jgi:hypothetical protein
VLGFFPSKDLTGVSSSDASGDGSCCGAGAACGFFLANSSRLGPPYSCLGILIFNCLELVGDA